MFTSILETICSREFWKTMLVRLILYLVLIGLGIVFLVTCMERSFIYHPVSYPNGNWNIPELGQNIHDVEIKTEDGVQLHGWWAPVENSNRTILWFHGNAGNLSHRYQGVRMLRDLGCQVLIIDYRGYGKSDGTPSEDGLYRDGTAAYQFLTNQKHIPANDIVLLGRSLGSAVATEVASTNPIDRLILVSPFTNTRDMVPQILPIPGLHFLVSSEFDSLSRIQKIHVPLLVLHGENDSIIPIRLGRKLYEQANDPKSFVSLDGAGHNNISIVAGQQYKQAIKDFVFEK